MSAAAETQSPATTATAARRHRTPTTFSSLDSRNFRLFITGQAFSNTGSWVQRIAQDWLVLSITGSATAVGITTALQFLPTLLFGLAGGLIADRYPKRRTLIATQVGMSSMAAVLAVLTLTHQVQVWQVYLIAFGLGTVVAVDNPTRQSFVNEMVGPQHLRNAISLNASVFQLGALIGPAISGVLINLVGAGYSFAINAVSYAAPMIALSLIRDAELNLVARAATGSTSQLRDGFRYVRSRADVLWPTVLVGVFGLFTINLPVTLAAYAKNVFHSGVAGYGLLSSVVAIGSLAGALISARRKTVRLRSIAAVGAALSITYLTAAAAPDQAVYAVLLVAIGASTLLLVTSANSTVQLAAEDSIRGRVMGVYLLVFIGSGAVGGPMLGYVDQHLGPQTGMLLAGVVPALATALVSYRLARANRLRVAVRLSRPLSALIQVVPR